MEEGLPSGAIDQLLMNFLPLILLNFTIFAVLFTVIEKSEQESEGCGIPVFDWL